MAPNKSSYQSASQVTEIIRANIVTGCFDTINDLLSKISQGKRDRFFYQAVARCLKQLKKLNDKGFCETEMYENILQVVFQELTGKSVIGKNINSMFDHILKTSKFFHPVKKGDNIEMNPVQEFCLELAELFAITGDQKIELKLANAEFNNLAKNSSKKSFLIPKDNLRDRMEKFQEPVNKMEENFV